MNPIQTAGACAIFALGGLATGYMVGKHGADNRWQAQIAANDAAASKALADKEAEYRDREHKQAADMAAIDQQHQEAAQNEIISRDRTITDMRAGTLRLRDRFAVCTTASAVPATGTGTGQRDAVQVGGLQEQDGEFLVRLASEANQVVQQLTECQAVVRADRAETADAKGASKQSEGQ